MYVIKDSDDTLYPADRCTFRIAYDTDELSYVIHTGDDAHPRFYPGNAAAIELSSNSAARPVLGAIGGRTGRFTPLTGE